jgi:hypothetical protein
MEAVDHLMTCPTSVRSKPKRIQSLVIHCLVGSVGLFRKRRLEQHFFVDCHRKDLQQCVERRLQAEPFLDDSDQHVDRHRDPYLRLHSVLRSPVKPLDARAPVDPLAKQLHRPATLVQGADHQCRQCRLVGKVDLPFSGLRIPQADLSERLGIAAPRDLPVQRNRLVAYQTGRSVNRHRAEWMGIKVRPRPHCGEGISLAQYTHLGEIQVSAVLDIYGARLGQQHIQRMNVVQLVVGDVAFGDMGEVRDVPVRIEKRVQLHSGLGRASARAWESQRAQIDGPPIQHVGRAGQPSTPAVASIERLHNHSVRKLGVAASSAHFAGIARCGAPNRPSEAHVIELGGFARQGGIDITQAFPIGDLPKRHYLMLRSAGERPYRSVAVMAARQSGRTRSKVRNLWAVQSMVADIYGRVDPAGSSRRGKWDRIRPSNDQPKIFVSQSVPRNRRSASRTAMSEGMIVPDVGALGSSWLNIL